MSASSGDIPFLVFSPYKNCVLKLYNAIDSDAGECKFGAISPAECIRRFSVKSSKSSLYDDPKRQILTMELDPDEDRDEVEGKVEKKVKSRLYENLWILE